MSQDFGNRPNFGVRVEDSKTTTTETNTNFDRVEAGAIWAKTSNKGNEFLSIRLKTSELEALLTKAKTENKNNLNLIAFTNKKNGVEARPDFRIFEEVRKG